MSIVTYMHSVQADRQGAQSSHFVQRLLRAEQVGRILGVDRSTIYRMAESGRLPAMKVGRQWRFPADVLEEMLPANSVQTNVHESDRDTMARAVQATLPLIELSAQILGVSLVPTDMNGEPVTGIVNPCPWLHERSADPDFISACVVFWKQLADDPVLDLRYHRSPLDIDCARTFVRVGPRLVGMLFAGGIDPTGNDERPLYRLSDEGRARALTFLPAVAAAISRLAAGLPQGIDQRSTQ